MRLETERLILREWQDGDKVEMAAIHGDRHVRRFYPSVLSPEETSTQIDRAIELSAENGFHFAAAQLKATGELAGLIGLGVIPDALHNTIPGHPRVEIGWVLGQHHWGKGLAPEGARAWLDYGWTTLNLPEIVAFTARINLPSQRVMEKIGMVRDLGGDFDHPSVPAGHPLRPHVLYRIANPRGATPS